MEYNSVLEDQSVSVKDAPSYVPSRIQIAIAAILCFGCLIHSFLSFIGYTIFCDNYMSYIRYEYYGITVYPTFFSLATAICFGLMTKIANNKATKVALIILSFLCVLSAFHLYFSKLDNTILGKISNPNGNFDDIIFIPQLFIELNEYGYYQLNSYLKSFLFFVSSIEVFIAPLLTVYGYSLIIINNKVSVSVKTWINMIVLFTILSMFWKLSFILRQPIDEVIEIMGWDWMYKMNNYFGNTLSSFLLNFVCKILLAVGYWHFARCEAFSGQYDITTEVTYSPLNKWMVMSVIVPSIMLAAIYILYKNYTLFI